MKNNFLFIIFIIILNYFLYQQAMGADQFNFDITEVEITENGNKFKGRKRGIITTEDGVLITADKFEYDKSSNILNANGNVKIDDKKRNYLIQAEEITYFRNEEKIFTSGKKRGIITTEEDVLIIADKFEYFRSLNIITGIGNVKIDDKKKDFKIDARKITYLKNEEKIFTDGETKAIIESKYDFESKDVLLLRNEQKLISNNKSTIKDDELNLYKLDNFVFHMNEKLLKGKNINIITNYSKPKSDKFFFKDGFFNFENKDFVAKNTKIFLHNDIFYKEREDAKTIYDRATKAKLRKDNALVKFRTNKINTFKNENDPRLYGVSSNGDLKKTIINNGIFTSCKKNDNCPPWSIKAETITHDKISRNLIYKNAILNVYDIPIAYFPKFFHPDPSVKRRSGLLQPRLNNSNTLGTSINMPYFHVISENKDYTFKPTVFDNRIYMYQNEYRQENENSSFIADFSLVKGYQSTKSASKYSNRNSITHLFAKLNIDLDFDDYKNSTLDFFLEKVNNDTYLKNFEDVVSLDETLIPDNNTLISGVTLALDSDDFNLTAGMTSYENLQLNKNDRFEFMMPYYDFTKLLYTDINGSITFDSNGGNNLKNTNNLKTSIVNNITYSTNDIYSNLGFVNNFNFFFKNTNITAKNDALNKSSIQSEILNIYEINTSIPLIKEDDKFLNMLTPKISFRINPSDMKDYSSSTTIINADNIFDINRLGLNESFESGKSLTLGINYKKEYLDEYEKYIEFKLGSIFRDKVEDRIPASSTANRKTSNLFGSITNQFNEFITFDYDFAIDNDLNRFENNSIGASLSVNNFITEFNFLELNGEMGNSNIIENTTIFDFNKNNSLLFKTRRNRTISLTEYYDLIYEYKNDCLSAGIKYKKTYYTDRDSKPKEDLMFTLTLFPLTIFEQKVNQRLYRGDNRFYDNL